MLENVLSYLEYFNPSTLTQSLSSISKSTKEKSISVLAAGLLAGFIIYSVLVAKSSDKISAQPYPAPSDEQTQRIMRAYRESFLKQNQELSNLAKPNDLPVINITQNPYQTVLEKKPIEISPEKIDFAEYFFDKYASIMQ